GTFTGTTGPTADYPEAFVFTAKAVKLRDASGASLCGKGQLQLGGADRDNGYGAGGYSGLILYVGRLVFPASCRQMPGTHYVPVAEHAGGSMGDGTFWVRVD